MWLLSSLLVHCQPSVGQASWVSIIKCQERERNQSWTVCIFNIQILVNVENSNFTSHPFLLYQEQDANHDSSNFTCRFSTAPPFPSLRLCGWVSCTPLELFRVTTTTSLMSLLQWSTLKHNTMIVSPTHIHSTFVPVGLKMKGWGRLGFPAQ